MANIIAHRIVFGPPVMAFGLLVTVLGATGMQRKDRCFAKYIKHESQNIIMKLLFNSDRCTIVIC